MSEKSEIGPQNIREILADVIAELVKQSPGQSLYIVGGAAIAFLDSNRRGTRDIDAWLTTTPLAALDVKHIEVKWNLSEGWLNDKAKIFVPFILTRQEAFTSYAVIDGVEIFLARPEVLLAMKVKAVRMKDQSDIEFLLDHLGIRSVEEVEVILDWCFPADLPSPKAIRRIEAALEVLATRRQQRGK